MRRPIRLWRSLGRHRAGPELSYHFLPQRQIVGDAVQIRTIEHDA